MLLPFKVKRLFSRLAALPAFPEREQARAAENLRAVLLTICLFLAIALVIGVPFVFSNRPLAAGLCVAMFCASALSWFLMQRRLVRQAGLLLIAILWLAVAFITLFSLRGDVTAFVAVMSIAYLLAGPRLALTVAASGILITAGLLTFEQFGFPLPPVLFPRSPQSVLFLTILFLGSASLPFVLINRQLRRALARLERFREVQKQLHTATWMWDITNDKSDWDEEYAPTLGLAPGRFSGKFADYLRLLHPDDRLAARRRFIDCLKGIQPSYRDEERVIWPDGSVHWLRVEGHASYGADGRATRIAGTITDITDRKRDQLALAAAENRFRQAFQASPIAIVIARLPDGRITDVNPAFEALSGYTRDEAVGRTGIELGLWADPAVRAHWFDRASKGVLENFPAQLLFKGGAPISARLYSSVVDYADEKCIITLAQDVTAQERAERTIRESEAKYAAVFDTCPEAIALSRASDGVMLEVNHAWTQQTGYARARGLGRSALELRLWQSASDRSAVMSRLEAEGHVSNFSTKFVRADGSVRDVLISCTKLLLNDQACIAWAWRDVDDVRQLERARAESDRRYRTLFDSAQDAIITLAPDGTLLDINEFGLRTTGYARDELIGQSMEALFDPQRFARNPLRPAAVLETGPVRMKRTLRHKRGAEIQTEIAAGPLPDGNILAIARDVSERNRSRALLQNVARGVSALVGETFFRSLVGSLAKELSADYCFVGELLPHDTGKVRTLAFSANGVPAPNFTYPLRGSPCENVIARHGTTAYHANTATLFPQDVGLARMRVEGYIGTSLFDSENTPIGILVVLSRKPIAEIALWTSVLEIFAARAAAEMERTRAEARVLELNASLERRVFERTAELESANHELESFSYSVSHDLRSPLRAIDGFAALLLQDCRAKLDDAEFSLLSRIRQNTSRMNQMIEDLLRFAGAGRGALHSTRIDMPQLVRAVIEELPHEAAARAQIVVGDLPTAMGDAAVLRQVWQNLIGNALKFSRNAAQPTIRIEGAQYPEFSEYTVSDNGAGFDPRHADKLFTAFQRLHTLSEFEGTGIGLAIVNRIVQRHGGSVSADGTPGQGATFRFTLPA